MLAKLLSSKHFFSHIGLGIIFLIVFFLKIRLTPVANTNLVEVGLYLTSILGYIILIYYTELIKEKGYALWFFGAFLLGFSNVFLDLRLASAFFFSTIILINSIYSTLNKESFLSPFDVGFYFSLTVFFYPPSIIYFLFVFYFYLLSASYKVLIQLFTGILSPIIIIIQILYLTNSWSVLDSFSNSWSIKLISISTSFYFLIPILIFFSIALVDHFSHTIVQNISKRLSYFLILLFFLNWVVITIMFSSNAPLAMFSFLCFPIALILSRFTQYLKQAWLKEFMLWLVPITLLGFYFHKEIITFYNLLLGNISFQI